MTAALPLPLRAALVAAGRAPADVRDVLVAPAGDGAAARLLGRALPQARLTAIETPLGPADLPPAPATFDLIWADGLFTRLDDPEWAPFLTAFRSSLAPRGILLASTHGRATVDALAAGHDTIGLPPALRGALAEAYRMTGFGYVDLPDGGGVSVASLAWVAEHVLALDHVMVVHAAEAAWDGHRDVIACMRA